MLDIKKIVRFFILSFVLIIQSNCGFSPIYAKNDGSDDIAIKLASVDVKPIKTIMGQEYVSALQEVLDPQNIDASKQYILNTSLDRQVRALAIESDRTVTRYKVVVIVTYDLKNQLNGKLISSGTIKGEADYDRVESDYATYVSENDTTSRVIKELAQDTRIRIISALMR